MSHSYTVYREALRHVREKQYVIVEADSAEEAVRKSKELSEYSWHEEMPIDSWIDSVSGHQAFLEDCGCEICDAPEPPSETLTEAAARYREAINRGENPSWRGLGRHIPRAPRRDGCDPRQSGRGPYGQDLRQAVRGQNPGGVMTPPVLDLSPDQQASLRQSHSLQIKLELLQAVCSEQSWLDLCPLCESPTCRCRDFDDLWEDEWCESVD